MRIFEIKGFFFVQPKFRLNENTKTYLTVCLMYAIEYEEFHRKYFNGI